MKTTLQIQNLKCGGCEATIRNKLSRLHDVKNIVIDHETSSVSFEHMSDTDLSLVSSVLSKLGYPVVSEENSLSKRAKSYLSCVIGRMNNKQ